MKRLVILFLLAFVCVSSISFAATVPATNKVAVVAQVAAKATNWVDTAMLVIPWVLTALTFTFSFIKAKRDNKTWSEAFHVAVNTLKVEDKMQGGAFKPELIKKVDAVSEALHVSEDAKKKVQRILKEGKEVNDLKIASINGKKIYLGDIAGIGSTLAAAIQRIRKIRL